MMQTQLPRASKHGNDVQNIQSDPLFHEKPIPWPGTKHSTLQWHTTALRNKTFPLIQISKN